MARCWARATHLALPEQCLAAVGLAQGSAIFPVKCAAVELHLGVRELFANVRGLLQELIGTHLLEDTGIALAASGCYAVLRQQRPAARRRISAEAAFQDRDSICLGANIFTDASEYPPAD
eukprot:2695580-Pyramimonas_sp.AAC.1